MDNLRDILDSILNDLFPEEIAWFTVRGIPVCGMCALRRLADVNVSRVFPITGDHTVAQAFFAFYHIGHGGR